MNLQPPKAEFSVFEKSIKISKGPGAFTIQVFHYKLNFLERNRDSVILTQVACTSSLEILAVFYFTA